MTSNEVKLAVDVKKKKGQKPLKSVLSSPYNQYWAPLEKEDLHKVHEQLEKNLPALLNIKSRIPWKTLKKLSKDNRTKLLDKKKEKIRKTENNKPLFLMRTFLSIGLNETSRCLSQDELSCIVVDGGPQSKRISVFLVNLAMANHVPVLICPGLLEITMGRLGFKSIALGIKKKVNNSANDAKKLISLQNCIVGVFCSNLTTSTESILCERMKLILAKVQEKMTPHGNVKIKDKEKENSSEEKEVNLKENSEETILDTALSATEETISSKSETEKSPKGSKTSECSIESKTTHKNEPTKEKLIVPVVQLSEHIYRYRTDKSYRAFIPEGSGSKVDSDFIAVGEMGPGKMGPIERKRGLKRGKVDELFFIDTELVRPAVVKKVKPNQKRSKGRGS